MTQTDASWPTAVGEMADRIRRHDWAATPLGPVSGWSDRLKVMVEQVLANPLVASLVCGPERLLIFNDAAAHLYGDRHAAALGRPLPDTFPEGWATVAPFYERAFAGETVQVVGQPLDTRGEGSLTETFDALLMPVREADGRPAYVHAAALNVGGRLLGEAALRESGDRQAFLLKLSDALRPLAGPAEIQAAAGQVLGEQLRVSRAFYVEGKDGDWEVVNVVTLFEREVMRPLAGRHSTASLGRWIVDEFRAGRRLVVRDMRTDERFEPADRALNEALNVIGSVGVPLVKGGQLVAVLVVQTAAPRNWKEHELELIQEAAERTWAAVERARAEEASRESEERFRQFAQAAAEGAWIRNAQTLDMEYASPAAGRLYGVEPEALLDGVHHWAGLIVPEDRDAALARLEKAREGEILVHEFRIQRPSDGAFRWIRSTDFPLVDAHGRIQRIGGLAEDVTEAKLAVEHQAVLLAELQHRVRNIMGMIRSMANRTALGAASVDDYRALLEGRLLALARVQALLTRKANAGGWLRSVIESEVTAQAHHGGQFHLSGPDIPLAPQAVEVLTLAFHELATNALKHGALSAPGGRLSVTWTTLEKRGRPWLSLDWIEAGAPPREPSTRRGFGTELIEARIPYELGGRGTITIDPEGARCHLEFPLRGGESILETDAPQPATIFGGTLDMTGAPDLGGRTVLVVEDDFYMAKDTAAALRGAGAEVLGPCLNEKATRDLLENAVPTHAVLDLNLGGGSPQFEIARLLKERGVLLLFLTGYDPDVIPSDMADVIRLQKPLPFREIVEAVGQL